MIFASARTLPPPEQRVTYLDEIRRYVERASQVGAEDAFAAFFSARLPLEAFHVRGLDHVGVYVGDYWREEEVEDWIAFLGGSPAVSRLDHGPSYVIPRHYATPGHWITCGIDGRAVELFTAKHSGSWRALDPERKALRLSHFALAIDEERHVRPVMDYLAHYPGIEILAFTESDNSGHTYGHLLNRTNDRVLEVVSSTRAPS